ncbi:hypothetical protein F3N42_07285 [Marinihelvus fidelis]|uniref:Zona occludens toxin N-terminal domain-containing protein n=1 Tax=Marinihelvus fidelis TaxID=2613842 RepID=A0A5N0TFD6_9GAMM|nr:zonular occludens toxin domain-containing protein [Marinihelvus fidelis]KAA9131969.1 hypothetical protein F3N42_07285 [Marinihelvus fidelis]
MLNIITGLPGAGKTLYTLDKELPKYRGRKIFVYGIPGLDHDHFKSQELEDPEKWYEMPEGSVIVIDEAQKVFPLRKAGSEVPKKCSEFETHRHRGFDILLLTQDATTLDVHIRKLAGRHLHVHRLFGGHRANVYEYGNYEPKPTDRNTQRGKINLYSYKYNPAIFDHYKSADIHTVKRKLPRRFLWLPVLAILIVASGVWLVRTFLYFGDKYGGDEPEQAQNVSRVADIQVTRLAYAQQFIPEIEGLPWTAPAYQAVAQVRTFPKPHCILVEEEVREGVSLTNCHCYSQQATKLQNVALDVCADIAINGWFDYTKSDRRQRERATPARGGDGGEQSTSLFGE